MTRLIWRGGLEQRPARGRRGLSTGMAISLIVVGAILLFALRAGSPHWLNLRIVGVILILAGALGMALPRLAARAPGDRMRRWVRPGQLQALGEPVSADLGVGDDPPGTGQETQYPRSATLADDLLRLENDPPV